MLGRSRRHPRPALRAGCLRRSLRMCRAGPPATRLGVVPGEALGRRGEFRKEHSHSRRLGQLLIDHGRLVIGTVTTLLRRPSLI
jgi:hypothetical protein